MLLTLTLYTLGKLLEILPTWLGSLQTVNSALTGGGTMREVIVAIPVYLPLKSHLYPSLNVHLKQPFMSRPTPIELMNVVNSIQILAILFFASLSLFLLIFTCKFSLFCGFKLPFVWDAAVTWRRVVAHFKLIFNFLDVLFSNLLRFVIFRLRFLLLL